MTSTLSATGLSKHYRQRAVVDGLSLEIHSGEVVGLLGPNGAGKTTAFYMIVGLVPCDDGAVRIDGEKVQDRERRLPVGADHVLQVGPRRFARVKVVASA